MSIPEKIMAPWYYHEKQAHVIEEALRFKDREEFKEALLQEMARINNAGCMHIHCFLISPDWFDVRGLRREDVYNSCDWAHYGGDKIECYKDGEKTVIEDDRPHAGHIRELSTGCTPIFSFADIPVYMVPHLKSALMEKLIVAVPK